MNTFNKILKIANENKSGFTLEIENFTLLNKGWAVAFKETQNCFNEDGLKKVVEFAQKTTNIIGGWFDTRSGKFYYDAIMMFEDEQTATQKGIENEQLAIFNLETLTEKRL